MTQEKVSLSFRNLFPPRRRGMSANSKAGLGALIALLGGGGAAAALASRGEGSEGDIFSDASMLGDLSFGPDAAPPYSEAPTMGHAQGQFSGPEELYRSTSMKGAVQGPGSPGPIQGPEELFAGTVRGPAPGQFVGPDQFFGPDAETIRGLAQGQFSGPQPFSAGPASPGALGYFEKNESVTDPYYIVRKLIAAEQGRGVWGKSSAALAMMGQPSYGARRFQPLVIKTSSPDGKPKMTATKILRSLVPELDPVKSTRSSVEVLLGLREKQSRGFTDTLRQLVGRPRRPSALRRALTIGGVGAAGVGTLGGGVGALSYLQQTGQLPEGVNRMIGDDLGQLRAALLNFKEGPPARSPGPGVAEYRGEEGVRPAGPGVAEFISGRSLDPVQGQFSGPPELFGGTTRGPIQGPPELFGGTTRGPVQGFSDIFGPRELFEGTTRGPEQRPAPIPAKGRAVPLDSERQGDEAWFSGGSPSQPLGPRRLRE